MIKVFDEVNSLDKKCYDKYLLNEDILMEHAANSMATFIQNKFKKNKKILIVSGSGNNGADGIVLARLLHKKFKIKLYLPYNVKSNMAKVQLQRTLKCGVKIVSKISKSDIVVDCLFGTGLNRILDDNSQKIITKLNKLKSYKIACDIPSGIDINGYISSVSFKANTTITMGALKKSLFLDISKDYIGDIIIANLGVQKELYEGDTNKFLLEKSDLKLPFRVKKDTHKGSFGHLSVIIGEKSGAGLISCKSAFNFGVGVVSAISKKKLNVANSIMYSEVIPSNTTAIALGMGLGKDKHIKQYFDENIPMVLDADIFYNKDILKVLNRNNIVLTPHPKEFCSLLSLCNIVNIDIKQLQKRRFYYVEKFCEKYPKAVLLLKGANVIIGKNDKLYINSLGTAALSFGGSGDILSGLIGALLAQGYTPKKAAISGSLAHTIASVKYKYHDFTLYPNQLIKLLKKL